MMKIFNFFGRNLRWPTSATAKQKTPRQNKELHGKLKNSTAKQKTPRQNKELHGKTKNSTAKQKISRQNK